MSVALDGQDLFDEQDLEFELGSISRSSIEKAVPGLDGVLSIDLGQRSRQITQKGMLQAKSRLHLDRRIAAISAFMDGDTHKLEIRCGGLVTDTGRQFDDLRMDVFKVRNGRTSSIGVAVDYEIVYTQLI